MMLIIFLILRNNDIAYLFCKIIFILLFFSNFTHIVEKRNSWSIVEIFVILMLENRSFIKNSKCLAYIEIISDSKLPMMKNFIYKWMEN